MQLHAGETTVEEVGMILLTAIKGKTNQSIASPGHLWYLDKTRTKKKKTMKKGPMRAASYRQLT